MISSRFLTLFATALLLLASSITGADPSTRFGNLLGLVEQVRAPEYCGRFDKPIGTVSLAGSNRKTRFVHPAEEAFPFRGLQRDLELLREPGGATSQSTACGEEGKKEFVALVADYWYLWYRDLADESPDEFATAEDYLFAITAPLAGRDGRDGYRFSYLTTQQEDDARGSTGAYVGFGFSFDLDFANRFLFSDVFQCGPAGDAGFARGDEVLAIDTGAGYETIAQLAARSATNLEVFGAGELGVERGFRVRRGSVVSEVTLVKRVLDTPPLAVEPLLIERVGNSPVGYLNLRAFIKTANAALDEAVLFFREAGVTDLVIDFRYNGGGSLDVADRMLDLLGALAAPPGEDSWLITHNDKRRDEDFGAVFAELSNSMQPLRIAFITTNGTASASELVINSLAPWIEVALIGEDTLGKAVGQYAFDQDRVSAEWANCDARLRLVTFEIVNGEGQGGYYNGLEATKRFTLCPAEDDISRGFGDPEEASLAAALGWLNNEGTCISNTAQTSDRGIKATEGVRWQLSEMPPAPFGLSPWVQ